MTADSIFAPDLLHDRCALVTGGGSGIGLGIARRLGSSGARVAIASRNLERLEESADRLRADGIEAFAVEANVRDPHSIRKAVGTTVERFGSIDILVNNAAGNFYVPSEALSPNGWSAVVETDLYGTFFASQAAFPFMRDAGYGRIVSISMTLHYRGWPQMAHACAAKAGVDALTRTLAVEWAPHGITVNAVAPGPIPTEGVRRAFAPPNDSAPDMFAVERATQEFAKKAIPLGRMGDPEDIGNMVTYLVSPAGNWITGAIFVVDGGGSLKGA
ncbi:MAG: SDR family oxidoreductase [Gemmatimonadota bacterium]|jgi:peroxisomal 2,4-dienoyl-CoA reductase|nr:MAG: SDR family oxidoreductase [Gemmatimonadota bacterium]